MPYHLVSPPQTATPPVYEDRATAESAMDQLSSQHPAVPVQVQYARPLADGGVVWTDGSYLHITHAGMGDLVVTVLGGWDAATGLVDVAAL